MFPLVTKIEYLNIYLYDVRGYEKGKNRNTEACLYEQRREVVPGKRVGVGKVVF